MVHHKYITYLTSDNTLHSNKETKFDALVLYRYLKEKNNLFIWSLFMEPKPKEEEREEYYGKCKQSNYFSFKLDPYL